MFRLLLLLLRRRLLLLLVLLLLLRLLRRLFLLLLLLLLLYSFLLSSPNTKLVVPVANDTAYSITVVYRYSSQDAHGTKLIDQYSFCMRSIGCSSRHLLLKLLLIYGSVFVSSSSSSSSSSYSLLFCFSLRLPPSVHITFPWGNLSPLPPCLLSCSGLLSSQRLIHSTWRYFAGAGTNLVYDQ